MKPSQATYYRDDKTTADVISQEIPLYIGDKIWMYNPNRHKALGWIGNNGAPSDVVEDVVFGHLEDTPYPNYVVYAGDDEASQGSTGLVFNSGAGERLTLGSRILVNRTKEIMRFTAAFASTTTSAGVTRNFGRGISTNYLKKGDTCMILPPAFAEGFTTGAGLSNSMYYKSFHLTEKSYPVEVTYPERKRKHRGGDPFARALGKNIDLAKDQTEIELLYGADEDTTDPSSTFPLQAATGLYDYITTNVYLTSKLSKMDFFDILTEWNLRNPEGGAILCSNQFRGMVTAWAMQDTTIIIPITGQMGEGKIGLEINKVKWITGEYDLIPVHCLSNDPYSMGDVFFVPPGKIGHRHLTDLDLKYNPISRDEVHSDEGELYGKTGYEFFEEETFARLSGLEF